jgi:hypothetical protein
VASPGPTRARCKELIDIDSAEGQAVRKAAFGDHAVDDQAVRTLTKHIGTAEDESLPLLEQARGKLKDEHIAKIVKTDNVEAQRQAAYETLGTLQQAVEEMKSDPATYGHVAGINKLEKYVDGYEKHIAAALDGEAPSAKIFAELDNLKAKSGPAGAKPRRGVAYSAPGLHHLRHPPEPLQDDPAAHAREPGPLGQAPASCRRASTRSGPTCSTTTTCSAMSS